MTPATRRFPRRAMSAARAATCCAASGGRGDHQQLGARQQAGQAHLDVAGAGGQVDQQVVDVLPGGVLDELLQRPAQQEPPPHDGLVLLGQEAHGQHPQLAVAHRRALGHHLAALGPRPGRRCRAAVGREKPQMSASSTRR